MGPRFHKTFQKRFKKLSPEVQGQFNARLRLFIKDPFDMSLSNHRVERAYPGCRSIDINNDYRAIYAVEAGEIIFVTIGTHAQLY